MYRIACMSVSNILPDTTYTLHLATKHTRMHGRQTIKRKKDASKRDGRYIMSNVRKKIFGSTCK